METKENGLHAPHPLEQFQEKIEECEVVVIDNVNRMPLYGSPYVSPHLVVAINHRGYVRGEYNIQPFEFRPHELAVIYPNHIITTRESSDDYEATMIVLSRKFLAQLQHRSSYRYQLEYQKRPSFLLTEQQYEDLNHFTQVIRCISELNSPKRGQLLADQLEIFSRLVDEFRFSDKEEPAEWKKGERLFYRFYDAVTIHFQESREIKFYADILCLSPKYFAMLIKEETGRSASEWITDYVIIQAKSLLTSHKELSVQQVADRLGFSEASAFSRYFRQHTGLSPAVFRNQ